MSRRGWPPHGCDQFVTLYYQISSTNLYITNYENLPFILMVQCMGQQRWRQKPMGGKHLFFHEYSCESLFPKVLLLGTGSKSPEAEAETKPKAAE